MALVHPVVHLVPHLPPHFEGVGTFALRLAEELARPAGDGAPLASRFVVGDPEWPGPATVDGFPARALGARDPEALREALGEGEPAALLVHYAGYGYHGRGTPQWLADGLEAHRAATPGLPVTTVFHEVWASGPPWRSSFWNHPAQRRLAGRLCTLSDHRVTTLRVYETLLARVAGDGTTRVLPMTSQVGELDAPPPPSGRPPRLAVFGGAGNRASAYRGHGDALERVCRALGIIEILDLGPGSAEPLPAWPGIAVRSLGALPAAEVSRHLATCRAGLVTYPPPFLPKSSVYAAYCAHGLAPVCPAPGDGSREGLEAGRHYLRPEDLTDAPEDAADRVAAAARAWYRPHRWEEQARTYRRLLATPARRPEDR
jgi:hypothetical protein